MESTTSMMEVKREAKSLGQLSNEEPKLLFQPGDLVAFSGNSWVGRFIRLITLSRFSHVGIICFHQGRPLLIESTTLSPFPCLLTGKRIHGVQAHDPYRVLQRGLSRIWVCRLQRHEELAPSESERLTAFLLRFLHFEYDTPGALLSGTRFLKRRWWASREDLTRLFCSELCAAALKHIRRFPLVNASVINPSELIREGVRLGIYQPPQRLS
ncbi:Hypothetical protein PBC10988_27580 [Planctomycetales bacterium 10988]|nr:Hypothetical protein PBC10988_27580 [Planctomycetales bacterium 10988]